AARVTNAGAIFVGPHSPVSLGDYAAGSNHVLPTGGSSRFTGGLGVQTFLRGIHVVDYDREALARARRAATVRAEAGRLPAHGRVAAPPGSAAAARAAPAVRSPRVRNIASARHPSIPTAVTTAVTITNEVSVPWLSRVRSTMAAATVIAHTNTPWGHSENGALQERIARCPSRRPAT